MKTYIFTNTAMPLVKVYVGAESREQAEIVLRWVVIQPRDFKFEGET